MTKLSQLPLPSDRVLALRITPAAERAIRHGHPWLYENSILSVSGDGRSGDIAVIFDRKNRFLAVGLYDVESHLRVRLLHMGTPAKIDAHWFEQQVKTALAIRAHLPAQNSTGYRLVHGENDGFGGLVIDRYAETAVFKLYSLAWLPHLPAIWSALCLQLPLQSAILRCSRNISNFLADQFSLQDGDILWGAEFFDKTAVNGRIQFLENGLIFEANVIKGQKTGFFLDQRENRARVEKLADNKSVLNMFSHSGGFSLYALRGGALKVTSVDTSQPALDLAERNISLNQFDTNRHQAVAADAFEFLNEQKNSGQLYDVVIIDPPSFAKRHEEIERALAAYGRLARLGIQCLKNGGVLVISSCSSRISAADFFTKVLEAAEACQRPLTEIERTFHAIDHPITFKESAYLKCLFARIG